MRTLEHRILNLKYNPVTERYDYYKGINCITTLTCCLLFNLYCDDEDITLVGQLNIICTLVVN